MAKLLFKRKIYDRILEWKREYSDTTALLINGARRIGKSTIVKEFVRQEYKSFIIIDFSNTSKEINSLFEDIYDLDIFFQRLMLLTKTELFEGSSAIVFDEVQLNPKARQAIKHLVNDGRYDYIETGSLLSIKKNIQDILIPSEEYKINMYPMDYEEFLWALGDNLTMKYITDAFLSGKSLGSDVHRKLMRDFRLYMLVGGMPQAVNEFLESRDFKKVDRVKRMILSLYEEDLRKVDSSGKASMLFKNIPAQLSTNASRYMVSSVDKSSRADRVADILQDMLDSMTINIAYNINDVNVGMALTKNLSTYKLFLSDIGLFVTLSFMDKDFTDNIIYEKLLSDKLYANLGYVYENAVSQMLKSAGHELYYHTFKREKDGKTTSYEVDFLLSRKNKIAPIEVKSSGYNTHKSLDVFCEKYSKKVSDKYLIYTKDYKKDKGVTLLPVYMTMLL